MAARNPNKAYNHALQVMNGNRPTLADQHLQYNLVIDRSRAIMTEYAMKNTEFLYDLAREIVADNPATTEDLKAIMKAYVSTATERIQGFGDPHKYLK